MRRHRVVTGTITTAVVLAVFAADHYWVHGFLSAALLAVVAYTAARELCHILDRAGLPTFPRLTSFSAFVVAMAPAAVARIWPSTNPFAAQAGVVFGFVILAFVVAMREKDLSIGAKAVASGTFVLVYVGLSLSFLVRLRDVPRLGEALLLFVIGCAKVGDMGAYFLGRSLGRHFIAPQVSPRKTVEGSIGAFIGSFATAFIIWPAVRAEIALAQFLVWAAVLSVAGQFGDLAESLLKRAGGVKDSGEVFDSMGGTLDLVDSLLLSAPVAYILALIGGLGA